MNETLARRRRTAGSRLGPKPGPHRSLRGVSQIDKLVQIDQSPIGRTPRSNPATYTGVFDEIRKVFAGTREAPAARLQAGRFSFNVKGGRCEECQGQGMRQIEMNFLPDLTMPCPVCGGARFNRQTLEVRYRGKSIADVLDMRVDEALRFLRELSADRSAAAMPARSGPGLSDAGAIVDHAFRRRGPADQAGHRTGPRRYRQHASIFSTNRRPACTSTTSASCSTCSIVWSTSATR